MDRLASLTEVCAARQRISLAGIQGSDQEKAAGALPGNKRKCFDAENVDSNVEAPAEQPFCKKQSTSRGGALKAGTSGQVTATGQRKGNWLECEDEQLRLLVEQYGPCGE